MPIRPAGSRVRALAIVALALGAWACDLSVDGKGSTVTRLRRGLRLRP